MIPHTMHVRRAVVQQQTRRYHGYAKFLISSRVLIFPRKLVRWPFRSAAGGFLRRAVLMKLSGSLRPSAKWEHAWSVNAAKCSAEKSMRESARAERTRSDAVIRHSLSLLWRACVETWPTGTKLRTWMPAKQVEISLLVSLASSRRKRSKVG